MKNIFCNFRWISFSCVKLRLWCRCPRLLPKMAIASNWYMKITLQTRRWSFGSWPVMRANMAFHKSVYTAIRISSVTLFYHPMVTTPYPVHGIRLYVYGIWLQEKQLADSKIIPRCEEVLLICYFENDSRMWLEVFPELCFPKYCQLQWGLGKSIFEKKNEPLRGRRILLRIVSYTHL